MQNILPRNNLTAITAFFAALIAKVNAEPTNNSSTHESTITIAIIFGCLFGALLSVFMATLIYERCCENKNPFTARLLQNNTTAAHNNDEPADTYRNA